MDRAELSSARDPLLSSVPGEQTWRSTALLSLACRCLRVAAGTRLTAWGSFFATWSTYWCNCAFFTRRGSWLSFEGGARPYT